MSVIEEQREAAEVTELDERVANGMAFLDERVPGWREKVDAEKLQLDFCAFCVVGQIFGGTISSWDVGLSELGLKQFSERVRRLGFDTNSDNADEYAALTEAWKRALA